MCQKGSRGGRLTCLGREAQLGSRPSRTSRREWEWASASSGEMRCRGLGGSGGGLAGPMGRGAKESRGESCAEGGGGSWREKWWRGDSRGEARRRDACPSAHFQKGVAHSGGERHWSRGLESSVLATTGRRRGGHTTSVGGALGAAVGRHLKTVALCRQLRTVPGWAMPAACLAQRGGGLASGRGGRGGRAEAEGQCSRAYVVATREAVAGMGAQGGRAGEHAGAGAVSPRPGAWGAARGRAGQAAWHWRSRRAGSHVTVRVAAPAGTGAACLV